MGAFLSIIDLVDPPDEVDTVTTTVGGKNKENSSGQQQQKQREEQGSKPPAIDLVSVARIQQLEQKENHGIDYELQMISKSKAARREQYLKQRQLKEQKGEALARKLRKEKRELAKKEKPSGHKVSSETKVLRMLTPMQKQAIDYVAVEARPLHEAALPKLERKIICLGYTTKDYKRCLQYIKNDAPIIIHLKEATLSLLNNDTHFRNTFETNGRGGNSYRILRQEWENEMFNNCYKEACKPYDRPKYGCLNITGDIAGDPKAASFYGNIFMYLHQNVRFRSTFIDREFGNVRTVAFKQLATSEYFAHVLLTYSDDDLKMLLGVLCERRIRGTMSTMAMHKEVQIQGPVCLATDVEALSVPGKSKDASESLLNEVVTFQEKTGCNILWQGDLINED
jgi:hypothetical protein